MNVALLLVFCAAVLLPISIHGLKCYSCVSCSDPFSASSASTTEMNTTTGSCTKATAAGITTRGYLDTCVSGNIAGVGLWCCNTDLCNAGQSVTSVSTKRVLGTLLLAIGMVAMIRW